MGREGLITMNSVNLGKNGNKKTLIIRSTSEAKRKATETISRVICEEKRNGFADVCRRDVSELQKCAYLNNAKRMVKNS